MTCTELRQTVYRSHAGELAKDFFGRWARSEDVYLSARQDRLDLLYQRGEQQCVAESRIWTADQDSARPHTRRSRRRFDCLARRSPVAVGTGALHAPNFMITAPPLSSKSSAACTTFDGLHSATNRAGTRKRRKTNATTRPVTGAVAIRPGLVRDCRARCDRPCQCIWDRHGPQ